MTCCVGGFPTGTFPTVGNRAWSEFDQAERFFFDTNIDFSGQKSQPAIIHYKDIHLEV